MLNMLSISFIDGAVMLPARLKSARLRANFTQEKLGVLAGIEEATARSRISQYESGIHRPTFEMMCAFARVLNVPECYFYTVDDDFAEAVLDLHRQWGNKT
ncbi:helix-turn-helix domain-containing protein [Salmonella enterica]|nr:XRE family transcriptional regulator [Salmonella enterica subsp. enterica serovar Tennessee str. 3133]